MLSAAFSTSVKMKIGAETLLLDTHVWIWLVRGEDRIRKDVLELMFVAAGAGSMFLSVMSIWELSLLDAKRRISLNLPCLTWVRTALDRSGALTVPLTPEVAVSCHQLPGRLHDDPIDRILVATARREGLTLITRDRAILDYAAQGHVRALPCGARIANGYPERPARPARSAAIYIGWNPAHQSALCTRPLTTKAEAWACGCYSSARSC
jgi:PIN domain nuclease of toxin-antitoxin system